MAEYLTSSGNAFSFSGWKPGQTPLECWDRSEWLKCLHGSMLCVGLLHDPDTAQQAVEDDGLLHELAHLANGDDICTHSTMDQLRSRLVELQERFNQKWVNIEQSYDDDTV